MDQHTNNKINFPWLIKMAWRDSRRNRSRLFLFISSIILGIGVLVAIYSLSDNVKADIDNQAKTLIGADLVIDNNKPVDPALQPLLDSIGDRKAHERSFASMVMFKKTQGTRLVQVRALEGDFPFYGKLETRPAAAAKEFRSNQQALVDKTLMLQFNAKPGDSIKVGEVTFMIAGVLNKAPGSTGISTSVAPSVYIPMKYLDATKLQQKGSRISYRFYYKFDRATDVEKLVSSIEPRLEKDGFDFETVESRKRNTGRTFEDFTQFLSLIGFIALLLGCIGVASSIHIYIREKLNSIAILRCLGVNGRQAFLIFLIQIVVIGFIGSVVGAILGIAIQQILPAVVKDFLPVEISVNLSWKAIAEGIGIGVIISALFALLPLVSIRNVSPLNTLRLSVEETTPKRDYMRWMIYALIILFIYGFTYLQMRSFQRAAVFTISILGSFLLLSAMARLLMWAVRKYFPNSAGYLLRQGLANLYRPNNQTLILIVAIGLGTSFISTLYFVQNILLSRVTLSASANQPNMVLFDIQTGQKEKVAELTRSFNLPVINEVPIITTRLEEINGKTGAQVRLDSNSKIPSRAFEGELRVTYRDTLTDSEKITEGDWPSKKSPGDSTVYISMEEGYARRINVKVGDKMLFNVQGALIPTVIGSLREVDWNRVQTNFRVVFPEGVLEKAPQFHVLITRIPSPEISAKFQQAVVTSFPNISIIDVGLILSVLDDILDKIGFVIRFMAAFSIITGLVVLVASVLLSKYQRIRESVLLRTLGGTRRQILIITALEYFLLGALAAFTGIIISLAGGWALSRFTFKTPFVVPVLPIVIIFFMVSIITVLIGLFNSRGILNRPPLEVLRAEG
ncbi:MAG TPA: FtsX-like permease family protein [Flavitalea sp.]|nr:FtsX-like permease family protein [Flavitalea sp.]